VQSLGKVFVMTGKLGIAAAAACGGYFYISRRAEISKLLIGYTFPTIVPKSFLNFFNIF
jgi:hypothetical protein